MLHQDVYIEKSVQRKAPALAKFCNVFLIALTVLTAFLFVFVDFRSFCLPLIVMVVLSYFVTQNAKVDFDYTYTNGEIEIVKILRKTRRKKLLSCQMEDVVVVAPSKSGPVQAYVGRNMKTYDCISHVEGVPYYTMIVRNGDSGQEIKVLFEPGEKILEAMRQECPDKIHV